jgi:hypothetical protein
VALQKQAVPINFTQGLDTKTDPKQVSLGRFLSLENSVFTNQGLLQKRNGFSFEPSLPDSTSTYVTTFNSNLTAIGTSLNALSAGTGTWVNKGSIQPVELSVLPLIRNNTNQSQADAVVAPNGLVCTVYTDNVPSGSSTTPVYKYAIADSVSGQNIVAPTVIVGSAGSTVSSAPRVFVLGNHFIIVFYATILSQVRIEYIGINVANTSLLVPATIISTGCAPASTLNFDGVVANNNLYLAWEGAETGGAVRLTYITSTLVQANTVTFTGYASTTMSVAADISTSNPIIYASFYDSASQTGHTLAVSHNLFTVLAPTLMISGEAAVNITSVANNGVCNVFWEGVNYYGYDSSLQTDYIKTNTITQSGTKGTESVMVRSVGLASKAFMVNGLTYMLTVYSTPFQPTYFLVNSIGQVISKLAYSNGGGYYITGLPNVTVNGDEAQVAYLYKDDIEAVNKTMGVPNAAGIYSQTGVNFASFTLTTSNIGTAEIGGDLLITGGFLWQYDGYSPVEQGFHLWPDYVEATPSSTGGAMLDQQYFYQATYEWADNQGNVYRSAPSIPVSTTIAAGTPVTFTSVFASGAPSITVSSVTGLKVGQILTDSTTGANIQAGTYITSISGTTVGLSLPTGGASASTPGDTLQTASTGSITVNVPTLRLTYKISNPVKISLYRWSQAQQIFYQVTSITNPLFNNTTVDYVTFIDVQADNQILGNNIIYTTGDVLENIAAPATNVITLFNNRLFLVDAEDPNLLWFSKQVIEATPVEMSDLLTLYVSPTTSAQGSTGPTLAAAPLDDKLCLFKRDAIYYINGIGPDNTGANSQYSDAIFITSTVGCANQHSIVFMPQGLMFQSDKGIWLLDRSLNTSYIGAAVEKYTNGATVLSALNIPGTNQVRFTLDSGTTLMYDYYYGQWGTFSNIPAISSTLYQNLHTYITDQGEVFQETPGSYIDGSNPVLMQFSTSWLNLAGVQGYQRAYWFYLLGTYMSPHKLQVSIAYDYNASPSQVSIIAPDNASPAWGGDQLWGSGQSWGGPGGAVSPAGPPDLEQWRVFLQKGKCEAFQISIQELVDTSYTGVPGAGLTLSGLDVTVGVKSGSPRIRSSRYVG